MAPALPPPRGRYTSRPTGASGHRTHRGDIRATRARARRAPGGTGALRRAQHAAGHAGGRPAVIRPGDPRVAEVFEGGALPREARLLARRRAAGRRPPSTAPRATAGA